MKRLLASTALALLLGSGAFADDHPLRGVALVIGESDYDQLQDLDNPKRDARAMDDLLDELGFDVQRVLDGDADKLRSEIADFVDEAKGADVALVYYSGHGIEAGGENYLVPTDTDLSSPDRAGASLVAVDGLLADLAKTVPVTIVLLDACRTDSFPAGTMIQLPGTSAAVEVADAGLGEVRGPTPIAQAKVSPDNLGMVIGFAASPGQPALDGPPGENSPYAAALLKHFSAGGYSFGDLMTMVSEEVYLKTKARQLPWVNTSLRRVLSFGKPVPQPSGDEAAIQQGRRQLLLSIASTPEESQRYVETVAEAEGVPLDALYGMLKVLGVDPQGSDLETQLREGAEKLKAFMAERPGDAKTDPELLRLAELAQRAQSEGAMDLALEYRAQASARADSLSASLDVTEANLEQDRMELGGTYAEHARTAELNFDFATAATMWGKAFDQVSKWDAPASLAYKLSEADAYLARGQHSGDADAFNAAVSTYKDAEALTTTDSDDWARAHIALARAMDALGYFRQNASMLHQAAKTIIEAGDYYNDHGAASYQVLADLFMAKGDTSIHIAEVRQDPSSVEDAIDAYAQAVQLIDQAASPTEWGRAQASLGLALQMLGPTRTGDGAEVMDQAIATQRAALTALPRSVGPLEWARTQAALAISLADLAQLRPDETAVGNLDAAIEGFRSALGVQTRENAPRDWAKSETNLGLALAARGVAIASVDDLAAAVDALSAARQELRREVVPQEWARATRNIGLVQKRLADFGDDPAAYDNAIATYGQALEVLVNAETPVDWSVTQVALGDAFYQRGRRSGLGSDFELSLKAYAEAMPAFTKMGDQQLAILKGKIVAANKALGR